jgi:hypothetical protein
LTFADGALLAGPCGQPLAGHCGSACASGAGPVAAIARTAAAVRMMRSNISRIISQVAVPPAGFEPATPALGEPANLACCIRESGRELAI